VKILRYFLWAAVATAAGVCLGGIALHRGEHINSLWLVLAAACSYAASTNEPALVSNRHPHGNSSSFCRIAQSQVHFARRLARL
jgi:hypothetical protein